VKFLDFFLGGEGRNIPKHAPTPGQPTPTNQAAPPNGTSTTAKAKNVQKQPNPKQTQPSSKPQGGPPKPNAPTK